MQGDNDVCPEVGAGDSAIWTSRYNDELRDLIKKSFGPQTALIRHLENEDHSYPKLSKQQLSKRLRKKEPDWPLAAMIIGCCTHDDDVAQQRERARFVGLYEAATGHIPKGYTGQVTKPAANPAGGQACAAALGDRDEQSLLQLWGAAEARAQMAQLQLAAREQEVDKLTEHLRITSTAHLAARTTARLLQGHIDQLRVQLSDTTALYQDQVARAEAADTRWRALWERYALLNASQEVDAAARSLPATGVSAVHRLGLARRINADAPAPRRALAVYLSAYRELSERHLGTIAAASRVDRQRLTEIFLAVATPSLDEAVGIATAVDAVESTVRRLHATIVDHIPAPCPGEADGDTEGDTEGSFERIVASMETPGTATVAGPGGDFPATMPPGDERVFRSPFDGPVAVAPYDHGPVAAPTTATVAGERRRPVAGGDASPSAAASRRRTAWYAWQSVQTTAALGGALAGATVCFLFFRSHPAVLAGADVPDMIAVSIFLTCLAVAAVGGVCMGCWRAWLAVTRLFYRGRHTRRARQQQDANPGPAAPPVALSGPPGPYGPFGDPGAPSLPHRFTPLRPGDHDRYLDGSRRITPQYEHRQAPDRQPPGYPHRAWSPSPLAGIYPPAPTHPVDRRDHPGYGYPATDYDSYPATSYDDLGDTGYGYAVHTGPAWNLETPT